MEMSDKLHASSVLP